MHDDAVTFPFQDNTLFRGLEMPVQLHTEPRALAELTWNPWRSFSMKCRPALPASITC